MFFLVVVGMFTFVLGVVVLVQGIHHRRKFVVFNERLGLLSTRDLGELYKSIKNFVDSNNLTSQLAVSCGFESNSIDVCTADSGSRLFSVIINYSNGHHIKIDDGQVTAWEIFGVMEVLEMCKRKIVSHRVQV